MLPTRSSAISKESLETVLRLKRGTATARAPFREESHFSGETMPRFGKSPNCFLTTSAKRCSAAREKTNSTRNPSRRRNRICRTASRSATVAPVNTTMRLSLRLGSPIRPANLRMTSSTTNWNCSSVIASTRIFHSGCLTRLSIETIQGYTQGGHQQRSERYFHCQTSFGFHHLPYSGKSACPSNKINGLDRTAL